MAAPWARGSRKNASGPRGRTGLRQETQPMRAERTALPHTRTVPILVTGYFVARTGYWLLVRVIGYRPLGMPLPPR
jgi:hypothetical protein